MNNPITLDTLMDNMIPVTETGCWLWLGETQKDYGRIRINGEELCTDKLTWETQHGKIPDGLQLSHRCNIRCCVNPEHLFLTKKY